MGQGTQSINEQTENNRGDIPMQGVRLSETQYKRAKVLLATYNRAQVRKFCNMSATTTNRVANSSSYEEYLNVKREEMRKYSQNKVSKSDPRHSSEISPEVFGQIIAAHALGVSIAALSRSSGFSSYILSHIVKSPNYEEWRKTIISQGM